MNRTSSRAFFAALALCGLVVSACAPPAPAALDVGTQAIFLAQTRDAAGNSANVYTVLALQTAVAATATRQATVDALNDEGTRAAVQLVLANATGTATRVLATEEAQRAQQTASATRDLATLAAQHRQTGEAKATEAQNTLATAQARASQTAEAKATAMMAAAATAAEKTAWAPATAAAIAKVVSQAEKENAENVVAAKWAPVREFLWAVVPPLLLLAAAAVGTFFLLRWYLRRDQRERIVPVEHLPQGSPPIVIVPQNMWGGNPVYRYLEFPPRSQLGNGDAAGLPGTARVDSAALELPSKWLNLAEQPNDRALPLGVSASGDLWLSVDGLGHAIVGGPTGSGKSSLMHAFVMGLIHRGMYQIWLCDGKRGVEFGRYVNERNVRLIEDDKLPAALADLLDDMAERFMLFRAAGARNLREYNLKTEFPLMPVVVLIDELKTALAQGGVQQQVVDLMRRGAAAGIHLILATQFLDAKSVPLEIRGNATTRVAFAVADHYQSAAILGSAGAEKLPKVPGRFLLENGGARHEVQAFRVEPPPAPEVESAPPSPFTELEKKMLLVALRESDAAGRYWFKTRQIAQALSMDDSLVTRMAEVWEQRGWLSAERMNVGRPGRNGREVLPRLLDMARRYGILDDDMAESATESSKAQRRANAPKSSKSSQRAHVASSSMSPAE